MIFENIDDEKYKDQKLSFLEKSLIIAAMPIAKLLLWKIRKAKTYGDLMKISHLVESKMDGLEDKYGENVVVTDEPSVEIAIKEMNSFEEELKKE